jgi:hypothetical protein
MNIGRPKRVIEVEPDQAPIPETLPDPGVPVEPIPETEPAAPSPAQPSR